MDEAIKLISGVGFPAAMCIWFAWRFESRVEALTAAIQSLEAMAKTLCKQGVSD